MSELEYVETRHNKHGVDVSCVWDEAADEYFMLFEPNTEYPSDVAPGSVWDASWQLTSGNPGRQWEVIVYDDSIEVHGFRDEGHVMKWMAHFTPRARVIRHGEPNALRRDHGTRGGVAAGEMKNARAVFERK